MLKMVDTKHIVIIHVTMQRYSQNGRCLETVYLPLCPLHISDFAYICILKLMI